MASHHRERRSGFLAAILILIGCASAPVTQGAPSYVSPGGATVTPPITTTDPPRAAAPGVARTHILVELRAGADEKRFRGIRTDKRLTLLPADL